VYLEAFTNWEKHIHPLSAFESMLDSSITSYRITLMTKEDSEKTVVAHCEEVHFPFTRWRNECWLRVLSSEVVSIMFDLSR